MPNPNSKQFKTRKDFMKTCIPEVIREGKTPEQAGGQCAGMWEQRKKKASLIVEIGGEEAVVTNEELDN